MARLAEEERMEEILLSIFPPLKLPEESLEDYYQLLMEWCDHFEKPVRQPDESNWAYEHRIGEWRDANMAPERFYMETDNQFATRLKEWVDRSEDGDTVERPSQS